MLRVALTGGIATGKSDVLARLASRGVPTIDADALVHQALAAGSPAVARIAERFGPRVVAPDGSVDRRALGAVVFSDEPARRALEALLHPDVYRRIDEWFAGLPPVPFAVADVPLLFETGHESRFDRVIVTACSPATQLARVQARDGLSEEEARWRLQAQWPVEEKVRRADYVVDTSGACEETDRQVERLALELTRMGREK
jgi:dephospho-CoA kinase